MFHRPRRGKIPGMGALRDLRGAAVFVPCYVALDWASYIAPIGAFNITPWNPQPALAVAWMLLGGRRLVPAVFVAIFVADVLVRDAPAGIVVGALTAATLAVGYSAISWALGSVGRIDPGLRSVRDLAILAGVVVLGAGAVGASFVGLLNATGLLAADSMREAWIRFWLGDAVGILVTAPLMLVGADPDRRRALVALARRPETLVQALVLVATAWLIFVGLGGDPSRHFYLFFIPLIWIVVRSGMNGAVVAAAVVQLAVVVGIHRETFVPLPIVELQALVAALTLTALFLGVVVDERQRATVELQGTLRLAAAGEMAGAIAHEVNQPLTALSTYGQSALLILDQRGNELARLPEVIGKMLAEAERASEVVRRLRDFFRAGTTRLETLSAEELCASANRIAGSLTAGSDVTLEIRREPRLPEVLADRLQLEVVLRNLLANALDAVRNQPPAERRVAIDLGRYDAANLLLLVRDSGPGVPAAARERVFEPFVSGKPSGMGLGLAVSRAIAEAHGGSLEVRSGKGGEFRLILPFSTDHG